MCFIHIFGIIIIIIIKKKTPFLLKVEIKRWKKENCHTVVMLSISCARNGGRVTCPSVTELTQQEPDTGPGSPD